MADFCLQHFGRIDVLVNNAGISQTKEFMDISELDWDQMMDVNLKGVFHCSQAVLPHMLSHKRGKIINISSVWGMVGASCEVHYSAAKSGVIGMTKALAKELGPSNIQVNCIAPGIVETGMMSSYTEDEISTLVAQIPGMRLGRPADIAKCVAYLISGGASYMTGQVISPNGGFVV